MKTCASCDYWDDIDGKVGKCRVRSPRVDDDHDTYWPFTHGTDWCGEWVILPDHEHILMGWRLNVDGTHHWRRCLINGCNFKEEIDVLKGEDR